MGFRTDAVTGNYVPDTVLNEDIRNYTRKQVRVIAVLRTTPNSILFDEITYVAKDIDLTAIIFPERYQYLADIIMNS